MSDDTRKLFKACGKGDVTTVKAILSANKTLDLSSMDEEGNTPMHFAAVGGHADVVKILIEHGANVEVKSRDGFTPMHSVAQGDHSKVLELLIEKGAHVDTPNTFDNGNTTLHYAACWGANECTKVLLKNKATVDAKAHDQSTPLSFAAEKGHLLIAKQLVEAGASLESKNDPEEKGGATPLLLACHNGQIEVLKFLIEKGANVREKTIDGLNAIHLAIRSGSDNEELIRILLDAGAECNGKTNNGDTPLHYAAYMGYVQSTQLLIERGARLEEQGQNASTPLHFAAREGKTDVVKLLVGKGANVDGKDKDGDTPLQCALINEHTQCAEYLRNIELQKKSQS